MAAGRGKGYGTRGQCTGKARRNNGVMAERLIAGIVMLLAGWGVGRRYARRRHEARSAKHAATRAWKEVEMLAEELTDRRAPRAAKSCRGRTN